MRIDCPRPLTLAQQQLHLATQSGAGRVRAGELVWRTPIRPTPASREYGVRIAYRLNDVPRVFIETPDLVALADGRRLPHVYGEDPVRLCLYLPRAFEWSDWMRIDQTIVPWAALWLHYFEEWLLSDEWKGGGEHPLPRGSIPAPMRRAGGTRR